MPAGSGLLGQQGRGRVKLVQGGRLAEWAAQAVVEALLANGAHGGIEQAKEQVAVQVFPGLIRQALVGRLVLHAVVVTGH